MAMDTKEGKWLLINWEDKLKHTLIPFVPKKIETHHLTLTTILWSALIILFSWFARGNIHWLWAVSTMIFFQYITDLLDGEIGRQRNTGLIKWGFYMDHFLDYVFLCAIIIGYAILLPAGYYLELLFIFSLFTAFMVNSFLSFGATNKFKISYLGFGPTEVRLLFIIINALIIIFGKTYLAFALPYVLILALLGLVFVVYRSQKIIWALDMEIKNSGKKELFKRKPSGKKKAKKK